MCSWTYVYPTFTPNLNFLSLFHKRLCLLKGLYKWLVLKNILMISNCKSIQDSRAMYTIFEVSVSKTVISKESTDENTEFLNYYAGSSSFDELFILFFIN